MLSQVKCHELVLRPLLFLFLSNDIALALKAHSFLSNEAGVAGSMDNGDLSSALVVIPDYKDKREFPRMASEIYLCHTIRGWQP